ncbi:hypothetical protein EV363DRAFT_1358562, partial [Boletus edulis]
MANKPTSFTVMLDIHLLTILFLEVVVGAHHRIRKRDSLSLLFLRGLCSLQCPPACVITSPRGRQLTHLIVHFECF